MNQWEIRCHLLHLSPIVFPQLTSPFNSCHTCKVFIVGSKPSFSQRTVNYEIRGGLPIITQSWFLYFLQDRQLSLAPLQQTAGHKVPNGLREYAVEWLHYALTKARNMTSSTLGFDKFATAKGDNKTRKRHFYAKGKGEITNNRFCSLYIPARKQS